MADRPATRADVTSAAGGVLNLTGVSMGLSGLVMREPVLVFVALAQILMGTTLVLIVAVRQRGA